MTTDRNAFVTLVTGLPRSGTSMMMRMLEEGGLPVLVDHVREADEDNPRGYYEFEPVKRTKEDPSWLESAHGKAVKLVYRLLRDLPPDHSYRALFMRRRLSEIHASQETMLSRNQKQESSLDEATFQRMFAREIESIRDWLGKQRNLAVLEVDYNRLMEDPEPHVKAIDEFLGGGLDTEAMIRVVEPDLYRQRR